MAKRTNAEWLEALQQPGDAQTEAFEALREYLRRAVFVYLRDRRSDLSHYTISDLHEMAEDFAQEALLSIRQNLDSFRGDARFTTWAYRFVINEAAAELRRRRYRNVPIEDVTSEETAVFDSLRNTTERADPALTAERRDLLNLLLSIIRTHLNKRQRVAIVGVHFQDRSIQEIAEELNTSANTVYKMLHDARKKIKAQLIARHLGAGDVLALFDEWS